MERHILLQGKDKSTLCRAESKVKINAGAESWTAKAQDSEPLIDRTATEAFLDFAVAGRRSRELRLWHARRNRDRIHQQRGDQ